MTGHACPECGVHRPGCACTRAAEKAAETAAAEDFDPLRIRPYVTLDAPAEPEGPGGPTGFGTGGAGTAGVGTPGIGGAGVGAAGTGAAGVGAAGPDEHPTAYLPAYAPQDPSAYAPEHGPQDPSTYAPEDPPTTQLAAIRPEAYAGGPGAQGRPAGPDPEAHGGVAGSEPHPGHGHPGAAGDASETMPLLLRGIGDVSSAPGQERARGRRRGAVIAAVAAVAVAGTAALAASVLGGADDTDDRAAVPEVTTSASLNIAVSEAPSPSSETPEPTTSSPAPHRTSASPSATPSPSGTTASASASASSAAPPAATPSATPTSASPTTTTTPSSLPPQETGEASATLTIGSSGDEVIELQARLTLAGAYHGDVDGEYDQEVWRAVKSYQSWMYIEGDPKGVYGPHTREVLERSTWL
ncbi:peptidoglycan-binding domain-containing protein [Streptomyces tanashiensis]|uniref:Peptidoglycan-binding protein n=1 Tax=Streptomyces tanashiensis TaxID=67367 RepID=A0ABY6R695_9ACTN|nr:peptidoglycan-binding domain-containing protein [Streptomyces tanashiensis]UZX24209.1 peptidoglycan-binding protein [Streptomyces tanashiensis]